MESLTTNGFPQNEFCGNMDKNLTLEEYLIRPRHYNQGGVETFDYINSNKFGYAQGNVIKYVSRYKIKDGLPYLYKARWYLNCLIEEEENAEAATGSATDDQP